MEERWQYIAFTQTHIAVSTHSIKGFVFAVWHKCTSQTPALMLVSCSWLLVINKETEIKYNGKMTRNTQYSLSLSLSLCLSLSLSLCLCLSLSVSVSVSLSLSLSFSFSLSLFPTHSLCLLLIPASLSPCQWMAEKQRIEWRGEKKSRVSYWDQDCKAGSEPVL